LERSLVEVAASTRLPVGFAGLDPPASWPPPRSRPRPDAVARSLDTLPGVGPTVKRKLAKLGLETIRDLLEHRPFRYEAAVPRRRVRDGRLRPGLSRERGDHAQEAAGARRGRAAARTRLPGPAPRRAPTPPRAPARRRRADRPAPSAPRRGGGARPAPARVRR